MDPSGFTIIKPTNQSRFSAESVLVFTHNVTCREEGLRNSREKFIFSDSGGGCSHGYSDPVMGTEQHCGSLSCNTG